MSNGTFSTLGLGPAVSSAIADMGFIDASQIQLQTIPLIVKGMDIVGQAQTGTGKTAAFGIPMVERLKGGCQHPVALVMCPTRELSLQVANELRKIAKYVPDVSIAAVYGGESIQDQIRDLRRGVDVVVGTPGRIIDHLTRGTLSLAYTQMVVLDEADEMLNRGFREDIETIFGHTPAERQTVLFSATMPKVILNIIDQYLRQPEIVKVLLSKSTSR
jgi:ATP-dependent RNA helicase DeaD